MAKKSSGRVLTVFLIIAAVLLVSSTALAIFFFQMEMIERKQLEADLQVLRASEQALKNESVALKKEIFLLEEKNKEADSRINDLLDDLELQKGLREELKKEVSSIRTQFEGEVKAKEKIKEQLRQAKDEYERKIKDLNKVIENTRAEVQEQQSRVTEDKSVSLEKIIVSKNSSQSGKVLFVDEDSKFVVINVGQQDGILTGATFSVFREDTYLGDIIVTRVQSDISAADLIPPFTTQLVKAEDQVYLKK